MRPQSWADLVRNAGEQPVGPWKNLLRKCKIGPFHGEFSLNIPDIRLKFAAKWPQFINFSLRFPKSDRLLVSVKEIYLFKYLSDPA